MTIPQPPMSDGGRARPPRGLRKTLGTRSAALLLTGVLFINLASISLWSWRTFASSQGFADVATDMLKEPAVREAIADQIVNALEEQALTARTSVNLRPLLEPAAAQIINTDAFEGIFHGSVRELHAAVFAGHRNRMLVRVDDAAELVKDAIAAISPELAAAIPNTHLEVAVGVTQSTPVEVFMRVSEVAGWLAAPFLVTGILCFGLAARRARDPRRAVEDIGWALIVSGVSMFALLAIGLSVAADFGEDPRQRTAIRAVFWSITHLLNVQSKVAITLGAVLAIAAANTGTGRIRARAHGAWVAAWDAIEQPRWKALVSFALIALSVFALTWPAAVAAILLRVLAVAGLAIGVVGLLDLVNSRPMVAVDPFTFGGAARRIARTGLTGITCVAAVMTFGGFAFARGVRAPDGSRPDIEETGCNGHIELCDRHLDEVTLAGTHNSMAASRASGGWLFGRQTGGLGAQLAWGVRAFLLDLHYGARINNIVRTDFRSALEEQDSAAQLSQEATAARDRFLGMLGAAPDDADRDVYLCHLYCELGATPAHDGFRLFDDFLTENPNEVVVLIIEDHVDAAEAVNVLERSGLADRAYEWAPGSRLPTLREMITSGRNVLIVAENEGGQPPWYQAAHDGMVAETGYDFDGIDAFSCAPGRGRPDSELFLVNHWTNTDPPSQVEAEEVNSHAVLTERVSECQREYHRAPNVIAVDYYNRGDLFDVVEELNGVTGDAELVPEIAIPTGGGGT